MGTCIIRPVKIEMQVELTVLHGELGLRRFVAREYGQFQFDETRKIKADVTEKFTVDSVATGNNW